MYAINFAIYLIQNDFYGGKYLWKRAPAILKSEEFDFFHLWSICKHLLQNSIAEAYHIMKTRKWSSNITVLISRFHSILQYRKIELIVSSYSEISLSEISRLLDFTPPQCLECNFFNFIF